MNCHVFNSSFMLRKIEGRMVRRIVSASGTEISIMGSTLASAIIYIICNAYTAITKNSNASSRTDVISSAIVCLLPLSQPHISSKTTSLKFCGIVLRNTK